MAANHNFRKQKIQSLQGMISRFMESLENKS